MRLVSVSCFVIQAQLLMQTVLHSAVACSQRKDGSSGVLFSCYIIGSFKVLCETYI